MHIKMERSGICELVNVGRVLLLDTSKSSPKSAHAQHMQEFAE